MGNAFVIFCLNDWVKLKTLNSKSMKRLILVTIVAAFQIAAINAAAQDFVYILPSKEIAETGEDLWFKAYLMDRQTFALSDKSQTLYLQIRSASDSVVWNEKEKRMYVTLCFCLEKGNDGWMGRELPDYDAYAAEHGSWFPLS